MASEDGRVWVGGEGALDTIRGTHISKLSSSQKLPGSLVTSLFEDRKHNLYVGAGSTLSLLERGKFLPIERAGHSPFGFVVGIAEDAKGHTWAEAAFPHELLEFSGRHVVRIFTDMQIPAARKLAFDPEGVSVAGPHDRRSGAVP